MVSIFSVTLIFNKKINTMIIFGDLCISFSHSNNNSVKLNRTFNKFRNHLACLSPSTHECAVSFSLVYLAQENLAQENSGTRELWIWREAKFFFLPWFCRFITSHPLSRPCDSNQIKSNQIYFSKMQDKYATTTLRIAEHRQENMAKPEGLKHTKLLALLLR